MAKKPRRGRPPLKPDSRRSYKLSVTIREKLRRQLEQSAEQEGRTLSQEVEYRIERSFARADLLLDAMTLAYGAEVAAIILIMSNAMTNAGRMSVLKNSDATFEGAGWLHDPYAYEQARKAAATVLEEFSPPGKVDRTGANGNKKFGETMRVLLESTDSLSWGEWFGKNALNALRGEESTMKDEVWIGRMKEMLGPVALRISKTGGAKT